MILREMAMLTVRDFCIIDINLLYIDDVLYSSFSVTSFDGRSHLVLYLITFRRCLRLPVL